MSHIAVLLLLNKPILLEKYLIVCLRSTLFGGLDEGLEKTPGEGPRRHLSGRLLAHLAFQGKSLHGPSLRSVF